MSDQRGCEAPGAPGVGPGAVGERSAVVQAALVEFEFLVEVFHHSWKKRGSTSVVVLAHCY